jgi:hypothetical protein
VLGPWSSGYTAVVGEDTHHPGPLLFWLLAFPARLPAAGALEVTVALVNLVCVVAMIGLARRRGGLALMVVTGVTVPVMLASLPAESYSDIWNPSAPLLPFALLIFLAWSLGAGEHRLLPAAALVTSFVPQCHLGFLVPAVGALAVGVGGLLLARRWAADPPPMRRWAVAAALVGLVAWSAPLGEQAVNRPGNAVLIARAATTDQPIAGFDAGGRAVVHMIGVPPWWLREPQAGLERIVDLVTAPGAVRLVSAALVLLALAAMAAAGARRRRPDLLVAGVLGLALCASLLVVTRSTPESSFATLGYSLRWASPAGMWIWLAVGWAAAPFVAARLRVLRPRRLAGGAAGGSRMLAGAGLAATALAGALVAIGGKLTPEPYDELRAVADRLEAELPARGGVRVDVSSSPDGSFMALGLGSGVVNALRREGRAVRAPFFEAYLGPRYGPGGGGLHVVHVAVDRAPPAGGRVIASMTFVDHPDAEGPPSGAPPPRRRLIVTLAAR